MILLTGVTGTTGSLLLEALKNKDIPMRAIMRDPSKLDNSAIANLEIVQGDFDDEASLEKAMSGVDKAFMVMPNVEEQLENEKRFIDVAKKTGVGHLVKLSASGANAASHALLKNYHGIAEDYLAASGLIYTSVRPNFYMQNMLNCAASINAENKFYLPMRDGATGLIDVADVAEFLVEVLTGTGHENKTHFITGPEILSFSELATQMSEVLERQIEYVDIPPQAFCDELRKWGTSDWYVAAVTDLFELTASNEGAKKTDTFAEICGHAPRSFRDFLQTHKDVFSAA